MLLLPHGRRPIRVLFPKHHPRRHNFRNEKTGPPWSVGRDHCTQTQPSDCLGRRRIYNDHQHKSICCDPVKGKGVRKNICLQDKKRRTRKTRQRTRQDKPTTRQRQDNDNNEDKDRQQDKDKKRHKTKKKTFEPSDEDRILIVPPEKLRAWEERLL